MRLSAAFKLTLTLVLLLAGGVALGLLHLENTRLRRRVAERVLHAASRQESSPVTQVLAARDSDQADREVRDEVRRLQAEIAVREASARKIRAEQLAGMARDFSDLATNREPTRGLVRLEYFSNRGQATPSDAFTTAIWAAMKGDEAALALTCTLASATREQAKALISRLPADARWTPEKLCALGLTATLNDVPALHVTGERIENADHAEVTFRLVGKSDDEKVNLRLGPTGWQIILPGTAFEKLEKKLATTR